MKVLSKVMTSFAYALISLLLISGFACADTLSTMNGKNIALSDTDIEYESMNLGYMSYASNETVDNRLGLCLTKTRKYRYATERKRTFKSKENYFYIIIGEIGKTVLTDNDCEKITKIIKVESEPVLKLLGAPRYIPTKKNPQKNRIASQHLNFVRWDADHSLLIENESKLIRFSDINSGDIKVEFAGDAPKKDGFRW